MKVLVTGGGAAGMMAAIAAADAGAETVLLEKNEKTGKKLYITGKGRCNLTNSCPAAVFFENVISNPRFLYSSLYSFSQTDVCTFLESEGLKLKEERGHRIFPASDHSSDVIKTLNRAMQRRHVQVFLNTEVKEICIRDGKFCSVLCKDGSEISADALILCTGGLSYPSTGSTGDGYLFASRMGHTLTEPLPALVPLLVKETFVRNLEGLSLRNIRISHKKFREFGEMLFTADGISGPVVLSASAVLAKELAFAAEGTELFLDLKPALEENVLDARIVRDFSASRNQNFKNSLHSLLPSLLIPIVVELTGISGEKKVHEITREERKRLLSVLKQFPLTVIGTKGFSQAVVTQGGVNVREVDPSTMQSRLVKGIYFAGELLDVDALTGGFNLQIAWSTGHLAGQSAAEGR